MLPCHKYLFKVFSPVIVSAPVKSGHFDLQNGSRRSHGRTKKTKIFYSPKGSTLKIWKRYIKPFRFVA